MFWISDKQQISNLLSVSKPYIVCLVEDAKCLTTYYQEVCLKHKSGFNYFSIQKDVRQVSSGAQNLHFYITKSPYKKLSPPFQIFYFIVGI